MKRKPTFSAVLLLLALSAFSGSVFAQANLVAKLDVKSIKSIQFKQRGNTIYADTVIIVTSSADTEFKLRKTDFNVQMQSRDHQIPMGTAKTGEILFEAGSVQKPSQVALELQVKVGPRNLETMQRLIGMFNVIGNPKANFSMLLDGESEVGVKAKKGWIYQKGISVELVFSPKVQKEVLFK